MRHVKQINIKNQSYYFFDDMVDIRNFYSNILAINKKSYKDIDIYNIGYIVIKKFSDCENIHSVNPLYLIIHSATGYFKEKNLEKYLIRQTNTKMFGLELDRKLKHFMVEKNCFMKKIMPELESILTMIYL